MSVTIIAEPQSINPAYNSNYFYVDSTNKGEVGFKYIFKVVSGGNTISTQRLAPIPTTLYGEVDIAEILQDQLGQSFDQTQLSSYIPTEQYIDYTVEVDEEYLVNEVFTDYAFAGSVNWSNWSDPAINPNSFSRTALTYSTEPVFEQGDVITVQQAGTVNFRPELEGIHTVLDKFLDGGTWYLVLDLLWIGSGAAEAGRSFYADGQKSIFTGVTSSSFRAWRGAFSFQDYRTFDVTNWVTIDNTSKLITTLPEGVRISRTKPTWLQCHNSTGGILYAVFNIDGTLYRYSLGSTVNFVLFNALPSDDNITEEFDGATWNAFAGSIDLSNVTEYTINLEQADGTEKSETITISLYSECDKYETYDICFMDRLGAWITIPFNKASYINQSTQRETIRKKYGAYDAGEWVYNVDDRGLENYHVSETIDYSVYSDQLTQTESQYIKELVSSPYVFCSFNGGDFEAINITNTTLPLPLARVDRDRKANIKFVKSVQDNING